MTRSDVAYLRESRSGGVKDFVTQLLLRDPTTRLGMDPEIGTLAPEKKSLSYLFGGLLCLMYVYIYIFKS
jgi:hypothetical protein